MGQVIYLENIYKGQNEEEDYISINEIITMLETLIDPLTKPRDVLMFEVKIKEIIKQLKEEI